MENGINLNEHIRILYRHRRLIVLSTLLVAGLIFFLSRFSRPTYTSTVKLAIFDRSLTDVVQDNIDTKTHLTIANQLDIIESQSFKKRVANALPPDIYKSLSVDDPSTIDKLKLGIKKVFGFQSVHLTPDAQVVENLNKMLSARHLGGGVIQIQVTSQDPKKAQRIAQVVAEQFTQFNIEKLRDRLTILRSFFENQIKKAYAGLKQAENELAKYKQSKGLPTNQSQSFELSGRLNSIENAYVEVKTQRRLAEDRLRMINRKLNELSAKFPEIKNIEKRVPQIGILKDKLVALEKQRVIASAMYTNEHPKMVAINQEIEKTVSDLKKIIGHLDQNHQINLKTVFNWQDLYIEKIFTEVEVYSLRNKEKSYKILADDYKHKLLFDMPKKEQHLFELVQNVETQRLNYQSLVNNNEKIQMVEAEKVGNVQILMPASFPSLPNKGHRSVKIILGAILGFIFGIGIAYLIEWQNVTMRTIEEVESRLGVPVLTAIPDFYKIKMKKEKEKGQKEKGQTYNRLSKSLNRVYVVHYPNSPVSESLRRLQTQLELLLPVQPLKGHIIVLTSPGPNEGKSTVAANLAVAMAQSNKHIVLIDSDLRRPTLHRLFQVSRRDGLVEILSENVSPDSLVRRAPEHKRRLELVTAGGHIDNPLAIFTSEKLGLFFNKLREAYDYIIVDTPPLISFSDPLLLGKYADGVALVIEAAKTQENAAKQCLKLIDKAQIPFLGVVINKLNFQEEYGPYNYYSRYYKNYYGEEKPHEPLIRNLNRFIKNGPIHKSHGKVHNASTQPSQKEA